MGRDNQPKNRQLARKSYKYKNRDSYARILIVTEGSKTEPNYLNEICREYRLNSANVAVFCSQDGTAPIQVVEYAKQLFEYGEKNKNIRPRSFDRVYAVFDRDDHDSYFLALSMAKALDGKLKNDNRESVYFKAIASVPSFELWLLLHFEEIQAPIHRDEVMNRLRKHIPEYEKAKKGIFKQTRDKLETATQRSKKLAERSSARNGFEPFTEMGILVSLLTTLHNIH